MKERLGLAILIPLLSVVTIAVYAGGLGVIFMVLNSTELEAWAVVILGVAIVVGVPTTAALLQQLVEKE